MDKNMNSLKERLEVTLKNIDELSREMLSHDMSAIRFSLDHTGKMLRPLLYVLRTEDEREKQRNLDRLT